MSRFVTFIDLHPPLDDFRGEVLRGLRQTPKTISPKFFYDARGSRLFEEICRLDEYYPTRTETGILETNAQDIADLLGAGTLLIEFGSGSSTKTRIVLDRLWHSAVYMPIDISKDHLLASAHDISNQYSGLPVVAVCADYSRPFELPDTSRYDIRRKTVFFPGSTIGNFTPDQALAFLRNAAHLTGTNGGLLIGVDLKKDERILHAAYNDAAGVTAEFNLNVLRRINRELEADFDLAGFSHVAFYNADRSCIEMHLESRTARTVTIGGESVTFAEGERIHTEDSFKYTVDEFQDLAGQAGYRPVKTWIDARHLFSVQYFQHDPA